MKKVILLSGLLLFALVVLPVRIGFAEPVANLVGKVNPFEKLELVGFFANESSFKLSGEAVDWMKLKNIVDLKANYVFTDNVEFYTELKYWYDYTYNIEGDYRAITLNQENEKLKRPRKMEWLRDCYLDIYTDRLDLRLGKQQVVWGTADGVRILDMVNPLDYREWTLKSYDETRLPLWMLKLEGELMMNGHLQLLLIPDYEPNYYAPAGSPFALRAVIFGAQTTPGVTVSTISERPERTLDNSKIGLRWRNVIEEGMLSGLEYTLNYLHTWDFASAAYTALTFAQQGPVITLTRRSEQIEVLGFSFAKSITKGMLGTTFGKGWTVRGEFAYIKGGAMNYGTDGYIPPGATVDVDQYNWVLGFDKTFWTSWDFSAQFIQMIANAKEEFNRTAANYTLLFGPTRGPLDKTSNMITARLATSFVHDRVMPEILILYGDDNDWRISPKVKLELNDNLMIATGFHFFEGDDPGLNGQFDKNDQFFLETKYSW